MRYGSATASRKRTRGFHYLARSHICAVFPAGPSHVESFHWPAFDQLTRVSARICFESKRTHVEPCLD